MKLSDINQKLTERPGGFGGIIKSKLKQQAPFMRGTQRKGKAEEALLKGARKIKGELQAWMNKAFRSQGGERAPITMAQFLGWVKKAQPKYAKGIEAYARSDKDYAEHFSQAIDKKGKQSSTASDPKVTTRDNEQADTVDSDKEQEELISPEEMTGEKTADGEQSEEEIRAVYAKQGEELEAERVKGEKQDVKASKGDDKEPKVDTSASIYEARLKAILEADEEVSADAGSKEDVGVNRTKTLKDNQLDTLITMGIEKQIELDGGDSIVDKPEEVQSSSSSSDEGDAAGPVDDFLGEYRDELVGVLQKVKAGSDLDKRDQKNASDMLYSID